MRRKTDLGDVLFYIAAIFGTTIALLGLITTVAQLAIAVCQ